MLNALSSLWYPTQVLADILTLHEHAALFDRSSANLAPTATDAYSQKYRKPEDVRPLIVAYVGDSANVLHDMLVTYPRLGHQLHVASPENERYCAPKAV